MSTEDKKDDEPEITSAGSEHAEESTEELRAGEPATFVEEPVGLGGARTPVTPTVPPSEGDAARPAGTAADPAPAADAEQATADAKAKVEDATAQAKAKVDDATTEAKAKVDDVKSAASDATATAKAKVDDATATAKAKVDDAKAAAQAKVDQAKDWLKPDHDSPATPGSTPLSGTPLGGTAAEAPVAKAAELTARPEVQVGLAFAGGAVAALLLKALGK